MTTQERRIVDGLLIALALAAMALTGCSKALTASRAVTVTQSYVDSQNSGIVSTSIAALTSQIGTELPQRSDSPELQRLIKDGYIVEKTVTVSYPNLAGNFVGSHEINIMGPTRLDDTFQLQTIASSKPPQVQGSFRTCFGNSCEAGSVSGAVQRNGPSNLTLSFQQRENPISDRWVTQTRTLNVSLIRGQPDALVGTYSTGNENPFVSAQSSSERASGVVAGPDIQQEVYVYSWTPKLPTGTVDGAVLKLGHLVIDSCDQLLLNSETTARATCKTHVKLTKEAELIFGKASTEQPIQPVFGKQPDGGWIGTSVSYTPPQYSPVLDMRSIGTAAQ